MSRLSRVRWLCGLALLTASPVAGAEPSAEQTGPDLNRVEQGEPQQAELPSNGGDDNATAPLPSQTEDSTATADAPADAIEKARQLFWEAHQRYDEEQFQAALELFERSYEELQQPEVLYNIALTHHKLGNCELAKQRFDEYLDAAPGGDGEERARRQLELLGRECPSPPAPPEQRAEATAPARGPQGSSASTGSPPGPTAPDEPVTYWSTRRTAAWSALGTATLAGGATLAFELRRRHFNSQIEDLRRREPDNAGDRFDHYYRAHGRAETARWISLVATGGFAALGTTLLLWPDPETTVAVIVLPSRIQLSGHV